MPELHMIQLDNDENIVFGPSRKAKDSTLTVKSEKVPLGATHTSFRTVCITNSRIIVESGDSAIQYPNNDISSIHINRSRKGEKNSFFNILKIKTKSGNSINIEIVGIEDAREGELSALFPNARIINMRGVFGILERFLG